MEWSQENREERFSISNFPAMSAASLARFDAWRRWGRRRRPRPRRRRRRREAAAAEQWLSAGSHPGSSSARKIPSRADQKFKKRMTRDDGDGIIRSASGVLQRAGSRWTFSNWEQAGVEDRESSESFVLVAKEAGGIRLHAHWCSDRDSASVSKSQEVCDGPVDGCFDGAEMDISGLPWRKTAALESEGFRWGKKGASSESGGADEVRAKLVEIAALEGMTAEMMAAFVEGFYKI